MKTVVIFISLFALFRSLVGCRNFTCPDLYILNRSTCLCHPRKTPFPCEKLCLQGLVLTPFCECKRAAVCKAIPCELGTIQDPSTCTCHPLHPIEPIPICDQKCPFDHILTADCECQPILPAKCGIRKCKRWHRLDKNKCACVERPGPVCEIACSSGKRVYPGACRCVPEIKCPIRSCRRGYSKSHCKCVKRRKSKRNRRRSG